MKKTYGIIFLLTIGSIFLIREASASLLPHGSIIAIKHKEKGTYLRPGSSIMNSQDKPLVGNYFLMFKKTAIGDDNKFRVIVQNNKIHLESMSKKKYYRRQRIGIIPLTKINQTQHNPGELGPVIRELNTDANFTGFTVTKTTATPIQIGDNQDSIKFSIECTKADNQKEPRFLVTNTSEVNGGIALKAGGTPSDTYPSIIILDIPKALPAPVQQPSQVAPKPVAYAKSINDLPAGTMVKLLSIKNPNSPKFLKVEGTTFKIDNAGTALKIVRDASTDIGFEAPNGNRLQSSKEGNNCVVSFANKNFGPWEKFTLVFDKSDPTIVWIRNNNTGGHLSIGNDGSVSTGMSQLAGAGPWEKFKIEIVK